MPLPSRAIVHPRFLGVVLALLASAGLAALPLGRAAAQVTSPATAVQDGDVDCGTDLGCFAELAPDCTSAAVTYTVTVDLAPLIGLPSGLESSTTDALRMHADPDGTDACQFNIKVERVQNRLLPEAAQALKDRGVPQASIDQTVQSTAASGKALEGRSGTCLFAAADLSAMLHMWSQGDFSTQDFAAGSCQGTYFGG